MIAAGFGLGIAVSGAGTMISDGAGAAADTATATFAAAGPHISVKADTVATIGGNEFAGTRRVWIDRARVADVSDALGGAGA